MRMCCRLAAGDNETLHPGIEAEVRLGYPRADVPSHPHPRPNNGHLVTLLVEDGGRFTVDALSRPPPRPSSAR